MKATNEVAKEPRRRKSFDVGKEVAIGHDTAQARSTTNPYFKKQRQQITEINN
jgi:hypothetical protein